MSTQAAADTSPLMHCYTNAYIMCQCIAFMPKKHSRPAPFLGRGDQRRRLWFARQADISSWCQTTNHVRSVFQVWDSACGGKWKAICLIFIRITINPAESQSQAIDRPPYVLSKMMNQGLSLPTNHTSHFRFIQFAKGSRPGDEEGTVEFLLAEGLVKKTLANDPKFTQYRCS